MRGGPESDESAGPPPLDTTLLLGFTFVCRPDCGLCCYATPRITPRERERLLRIVPEASIIGSGSDQFLAARGDGGACQFLREHRCSVHALRPAPCREFPVTVHVGRRLQASLALGCPGVALSGLSARRRPRGSEVDASLAPELESVASRIGPEAAVRLERAGRRRRRIARSLVSAGLWVSEEEVRARLLRELPMPGREEFPVEDPPLAEEGIEALPLFFDERPGPVALAQGLGGWELRELGPSGRGSRLLEVIPPPDGPPKVDGPGLELLRGYLGYWLQRDALFGLVHLRVVEAGSPDVLTAVRDELRAIGAQVLSRAEIRAKLAGETPGTLTRAHVELGIRAYDLEGLDRPTWGDRL